MRYVCYQLLIDSEIELPELHPSTALAAATPDVTIVRGPLGVDGSACGEQRGPFLWMSQEAMWLHIPGVARYQVENGNRITVAAEPGVDEASVRLFMHGSAFGALLAQRGRMVLHGNAVQVGDRALVCVGHSGAGKSTLAAALMQRGHDVFADDVVAIDAQGCALPGLPRIKLWKDAAEQLTVPTADLSRIRPAAEKFNLPLADAVAVEPVPIRWLYLLQTHDAQTVKITPVRGVECFKLLQDNLYRARILRAMSPLPEHLALMGRMATRVRIARVERPRHGFAIDALVDALLADTAANS